MPTGTSHRAWHGWKRWPARLGGWAAAGVDPAVRRLAVAAAGDWGGFGDNFRIGRMLASGDLRLIALYFIEQQPRHGYDLIKAIEEKTGGIYSPSPGVIYPALTFLEEANYVTSVAEGNKRLYTITDEGRAHLNDNRAAVESTLAHLAAVGEQFDKVRDRWAEVREDFATDRRRHGGRITVPTVRHHGPHHDRDMHDVEPDVNDARRDLKDAIKQAARSRSVEKQHRLADILRRAADEIREGHRPPPPPRRMTTWTSDAEGTDHVVARRPPRCPARFRSDIRSSL